MNTFTCDECDRSAPPSHRTHRALESTSRDRRLDPAEERPVIVVRFTDAERDAEAAGYPEILRGRVETIETGDAGRWCRITLRPRGRA